MQNVQMKVEGDTLHIVVDITKRLGPSSSGKTILVASTGGNVAAPERPEIKVGLNVYTSNGGLR